ncbi:MAG: hypothetical protein LBI61_03360 [Puniceicoccales bacterium]|jgi:NADH:ubiquinone oxidoreductase subunit 2 (subunit N)|nr:hypothetical protein [Puniceicoccales bacterium]
MGVSHTLLFFFLYAAGHLPGRMRPRALLSNLFLHGGSKVLLLYFLYFAPVEPFGTEFYALNAAMALAIAFALYADNYARFFERTDLAQSVFLADAFALGFPCGDLSKFLWSFPIPYLASGGILCAIRFLKEAECDNGAVYIENFHDFFPENKLSATSFAVALSFLLGTPPLHGAVWRTEFARVIYGSGRPLSLAMFIICFCSIGYVYFKWLLAVFQKKPPRKNGIQRPSTLGIDAFVFLCAAVMVVGAFLV